MKTDSIDLLYIPEVPINGVPETAEEFDQLAGRTGACLDNGWDYQKYHVHARNVREKAQLKLEELSGLAIEKETKGTRTVLKEKPQQYVDRLIKTEFNAGEDYADADAEEDAIGEFVDKYGEAIRELGASLTVDLTKKPRAIGGSSKISAAYIEFVQKNIIDAGKLDAFIKKYNVNRASVISEDGEISEDNVANLARAYRGMALEKKREAAKKAKAEAEAALGDL